MLSERVVQDEISSQFPKEEIHRRNTGYALDEIIKMKPFNSLTKLSGKNLERVYSLVLRDKKKFG